MELHNASDEQKRILSYVKKNYNLIINAVAGSGKTSSSLHIANENKNKKILLLTYNARLKIESRKKVEHLVLKNIEIHTYHSFCKHYYSMNGYTDLEIIKLLRNNDKLVRKLDIDILILDECQDMTKLYYNIVLKVLKENKSKNTQMILFGDEMQSIYKYNGSDYRFLTLAYKLFPKGNRWKRLKLKTSFRIPENISCFINFILQEKRIVPYKLDHGNVEYILCDLFKDLNAIFVSYIKKNLASYKPEDFFILAPSVRSKKNSPLNKLENILVNNKIPIYVPSSDDEKLDENIIKNKLVISSFHGVKGLERKIVIILGFDDSYFKFYNKSGDPTICSNEIYVATTRAIDKLILLHHYQNDFLSFIDVNRLSLYCDYIQLKKIFKKQTSTNNIRAHLSELTRNMSTTVLNSSIEMIEYEQIKKPTHSLLNIPCKIQIEDMWENVSDITETAVISLYEYRKIKKTPSIIIYIEKNMNLLSNKHKEIVNMLISEKFYTIKTILHLSNFYLSMNNNHINRLGQIKKYDWLTEEHLFILFKNIEINDTNILIFKKYISCKFNNKEYYTYIDIVSNDHLYQLKVSDAIKPEHILQLAIYSYVFKIKEEKQKVKPRIINVLTNEIIDISYDEDKIKNMIRYILRHKINTVLTSDKEFISSILLEENITSVPSEHVKTSESVLFFEENL